MSSGLFRSLSIVLPALALCLGGAPQANARTINLNCASKPLQGAVDRANPGDTVRVSGTCNEQIVVRVNNLTLDGFDGVNWAVIDGTGFPTGAMVSVRATDVRIRGFNIINGPGSGIHVAQSSSAMIEMNFIQDNGTDGVSVSGSSYARIGPSSAHPVAGDGDGNVIQDNAGRGIDVRGSASADVFHNYIDGNLRGIEVANAGSANLAGNTITFSGERGISLATNGSVVLGTNPSHNESNLIQNSPVGLWCELGGSASGNLQSFAGNGMDTQFDASCAVSDAIYIP